MVTPFIRGVVDFKSLEKLVAQQIQGGISGFVVNGTTAESPTLEAEEVKDIFNCVRGKAGSAFPIVLGIGTNSTRSTVAWAERATQWGAQAALAVVPYYNKPPQRGMYLHFKTVAENSGVPIVLYNVPSRTVAGLELETIAALSKLDRIVGIKESTGNISFMEEIRKATGPEFAILSGDDDSCVEFCLRGGDGVISVCSHVIPSELSEFISRAKGGDKNAAKEFDSFKSLMKNLYIEANPIPVKKALQLMGIISSEEMRLPLVSLNESYAGELLSCLKEIKKA